MKQFLNWSLSVRYYGNSFKMPGQCHFTYVSFVAKQRTTFLWIESLDSLLYALQIMPPSNYIFDV